jgi:hypothetical protein
MVDQCWITLITFNKAYQGTGAKIKRIFFKILQELQEVRLSGSTGL